MVSEHVRQNIVRILVARPEFSRGDYEVAMTKAFAVEDALLLKYTTEQGIEPVTAGSTVALCLVNLTRGILVVGNVGDSHILFAKWDAGNESIVWQVRFPSRNKTEGIKTE